MCYILLNQTDIIKKLNKNIIFAIFEKSNSYILLVVSQLSATIINSLFWWVCDKKLFPIYKYKFSVHHPLSIKAQAILEQRRLKMLNEGYSQYI